MERGVNPVSIFKVKDEKKKDEKTCYMIFLACSTATAELHFCHTKLVKHALSDFI